LSRFLRLSGLVVLIWASLVVLSFLMSLVLGELAIIDSVGSISGGILRVVLGTTLGVIWLAVWRRMATAYMASSMRRRH
jgi:hypothetical protein